MYWTPVVMNATGFHTRLTKAFHCSLAADRADPGEHREHDDQVALREPAAVGIRLLDLTEFAP
jgi:hypothetical protein